MRAGSQFLAGLLLGAAITWLLHPLLSEAEVVRYELSAAGPVAPNEPAGAAGLHGLANARPPPALDEEAVDPQAVQARLTPEALALLGEFEAGGFASDEAARAGWQALATLYALSGREEDLLRLLEFAFAAGTDPSEILTAVQGLPRARQAAVLDLLLAAHPDAAWNWTQLADLYLEVGARQRAAEVMRTAVLAADELTGDMITGLVRADPRTAGPFLQQLVRDRELPASTIVQIAQAFAGEEQSAMARSFYLSALTLTPDDDEIVQYLSQVDLGAALAHAERRIESRADQAGAWSTLADLRVRSEDKAGAFKAYLEAARLEPSAGYMDGMLQTDPQAALPLIAQLTIGSEDDEAIGTLADAYLLAGNKKAALEVYLRAHEHDPNDSEWLRNLVKLDPQLAAERMDARIEEDPESAGDELLGAHGNALLAIGNGTAAFDRYLEAHRKDVGDYEWQMGMAEADPNRAIAILEEELDPDNPDSSLYGALGTAYVNLGRRSDALAYLDRALDQDQNGRWYKAMARLDPRRALRRIHADLRSQPANDELWGALGNLHLELGNPAEARSAYRRALDLDPSDSEWRMQLALVDGR